MLSRAKSLLLNAALAVALLAGAVAVAAETGLVTTHAPTQGSPAASERGGAERITVRGRVNGLYPGRVEEMRVRVRSPFTKPVLLRFIRTTVQDASASCTGQNLHVKRFRGRQPIAARGTTMVRVRVTMAQTAPDACQNARFPLEFVAQLQGEGQRP
jgi:hypothetical protein